MQNPRVWKEKKNQRLARNIALHTKAFFVLYTEAVSGPVPKAVLKYFALIGNHLCQILGWQARVLTKTKFH